MLGVSTGFGQMSDAQRQNGANNFIPYLLD